MIKVFFYIFDQNFEKIGSYEEEEYTPKLFSEEHTAATEETINELNDQAKQETDELFDQDAGEEEEFEIPAFLRKQKY